VAVADRPPDTFKKGKAEVNRISPKTA